VKALSPVTIASTTSRPVSTPLLGSSPYRLKQVSRIIRHLRDQLQHSRPQLLSPSDHDIEMALENCPAILLSGDDWQQIIGDILTHLHRRLTTQAVEHESRSHCGRSTSMHGTFTTTDALAFISTLLEQHFQSVS